MVFDNTKKKILTVKIVSCIIINFLRLREVHTKITSGKLIDRLNFIKDLSKLSYDILTFNLFSILYNSVPLYLKLKKNIKLFFNK